MEYPIKILVVLIIAIVAVLILIALMGGLTGDASSAINTFFGDLIKNLG